MTTVAVSQTVPIFPGNFYFRMHSAILAIAVFGFFPTYWLPMMRGTLQVPPILHLHALFFYGWVILAVWQSWLVRIGRVGRHREFGMLGIALASGMCFVGLATAVNRIRAAEGTEQLAAVKVFSIVPVSLVITFAPLVGLAIYFVKKPEWHKRLILVATAGILQAAIARAFIVLMGRDLGGAPPPIAVTLMPAAVTDVLIVVAILHDRRIRRVVHPAYWVAGGLTVLVQLGRAPLSETALWAAAVDWLVALAP
jgi:hypothetical protein